MSIDNNKMFTYYLIELLFMSLYSSLSIIDGFMNILFARIFSQNSFNIETFKYIRINAIVDAVLTFMQALIPYTFCSYVCPWQHNKVLFAINIFVVRSLKSLSALISIIIVSQRYLNISKAQILPNNKSINKVMIVIVICLSILIHSPYLALKITTTIKTNNHTKDILEIIGHNEKSFESLLSYIQCFTNILFLLIMCSFTTLLVLKLRKRKTLNVWFKRVLHMNPSEANSSKCDTTHENQESFLRRGVTKRDQKTTHLVIWISTIFIFDQIVGLLHIITPLFIGLNQIEYKLFVLILPSIASILHCCNTFVYYKYNYSFRVSFKNIRLIRVLGR